MGKRGLPEEKLVLLPEEEQQTRDVYIVVLPDLLFLLIQPLIGPVALQTSNV